MFCFDLHGKQQWGKLCFSLVSHFQAAPFCVLSEISIENQALSTEFPLIFMTVEPFMYFLVFGLSLWRWWGGVAAVHPL